MRFTEFDIKKVKNPTYRKYSKNTSLLDQFKKSGLKCAKVTDYTNKKASYCSTSLQSTINRLRNEYKDIICIYRSGEIFLINEAVD